MIWEKHLKLFILLILLLFLGVSVMPVAAEEGAGALSVASPTIIGTGEPERNDGTADEASFTYPMGLAYSKKLNALIIADTQNHRICSLDLKTLIVKTIAGSIKGTDRFGYPGGGYIDGDTSKAMFKSPKGVAIAENGAIIVADTGNHALRQIYEGQVTTIAGGKLAGYKDGKGTSASFFSPSGVAIDQDGSIFVADTLNDVIRKVDATARVTTYAGKKDDQGLLNEPVGIVIDDEGILYVADGGNHQIKKISAKDEVETLAGGSSIMDEESGYWLGAYADGAVDAAAFNFPKGIALKGDGTILIADTYNHVIRAIEGQAVSTIIGAGVAGEGLDEQYVAYLDGPAGICYADEMLFVADRWNNRILIIPDLGEYLAPIAVSLKGGTKDEPMVYLNGKEVAFADVKPLVIDGDVAVPIRAIAEAWGGTVNWNQAMNAVEVQKGDSLIGFNAEDFTLYEGRSLVGLEVLQNAFGFDIEWLEQEFMISIRES